MPIIEFFFNEDKLKILEIISIKKYQDEICFVLTFHGHSLNELNDVTKYKTFGKIFFSEK